MLLSRIALVSVGCVYSNGLPATGAFSASSVFVQLTPRERLWTVQWSSTNAVMVIEVCHKHNFGYYRCIKQVGGQIVYYTACEWEG